MPDTLSPSTLHPALAALRDEARKQLAATQASEIAAAQYRQREAWREFRQAVLADLGASRIGHGADIDLVPYLEAPLSLLPPPDLDMDRLHETSVVLLFPGCARIVARYHYGPWRRVPWGQHSNDVLAPAEPPLWMVLDPYHGALFLHTLGAALVAAEAIGDRSPGETDIPF